MTVKILFVVVPIVFFIAVLILVYVANRRTWNRGYCRRCGGWLESFDMDSSGATGYKCLECGCAVWIGIRMPLSKYHHANSVIRSKYPKGALMTFGGRKL